MSWILTPVGSAYFGSAYALYFPIYSLAVAGFPAAVARMVSARAASGRLRSVRALRGVCVRLFFLLGLLAFGAMVLFSFPYARLTAREAPETVLPARCGRWPRPRFSAACSPFTAGLYEGLSNMTPTAVSQILEAACKLVFGLGLSYGGMALALREYAASGTVWGVPQPSASYARLSALPACAGGAVFGVTIGGAVGLLYRCLLLPPPSGGLSAGKASGRPAARKRPHAAARAFAHGRADGARVAGRQPLYARRRRRLKTAGCPI